ncbi:MAG: tetratricopeptide repeat protein [Thermoanaerobaculia bacterium]
MRRAFTTSSLLLAGILIVAGCGSSGDLAKPETQRQFGVRMAKMNLWREAMFRFQRAVEIEPDNAMAHNNLAVALEANGDFDDAAKEYREALRLDRSNQYIQKNYSRFVEFTQKSKKRELKPTTTTAAAETPTTPTTTTAPPATTTAPPEPTPIAPPSVATPTPEPTTTTNPPLGGLQ